MHTSLHLLKNPYFFCRHSISVQLFWMNFLGYTVFCFPFLQDVLVEREEFFCFVKRPEATLNMQEKSFKNTCETHQKNHK